MAMIYALAEYLSLPFAQKLQYLEALSAGNNRVMRKAAFLDAQSHSNFSMRSNPFISVRFGSQIEHR
jgi:hypothetical protein